VRTALVVLALALVAAAPAELSAGERERGGGGGGGPQWTFISDVPEHPVDVLLARPTVSSVTLSVLAYRDLEGYVAYGTAPELLTARTPKRAFRKGEPEEIVIAGLKLDTAYAYQLRAAGTDAPMDGTRPGVFHTRRAAGSPFVFTVQADSHLDNNTRPELYDRTIQNALADKPDFHIDLGDTFMTEKMPGSFRDASRQYLAQRYHFGLLGHAAPLFLVLGNHDGEGGWLHDGTPDSMAVWSNAMRKKYFPNPEPDGFYTGNGTRHPQAGLLQDYYAWEWGDALFVVLDPFWPTTQRARRDEGCWNRTLGQEQYRWLGATLAASQARFKFVFIHQLVGGLDHNSRGGVEAAPFYEWGGKNLDGSDGFRTRRPGWELPIHALLVRHRVSAVFHGHDHFYARQELDGIVYQMVPQPGHYNSREPDRYAEYGYTSGTLLPSAGHVRVAVTPAQADVAYVRAYMPRDETDGRKNGHIEHAYTLGAATAGKP
jgi:hypothetical protein